ncbi:LLM class flavin-dependent oxidoreductase [Glaciibacter flavus]|uniref:LLM class flavin-dependent oxidoreductase n=1 Tax=Orlajensenia flava TaxID=2565934 RepID=A0A4S4FUP0_9MICO|nr:LLM class flavin-dependent oxidoreductase [Glaciibacter flavus]THG34433.1 LLM class flavin-dependent oxidoreductase [Glaciibacter flavus]
MPDYGHDLRFGAFITPNTEGADRILALTRHAEQLGFDYATFQDHPYQPAFFDTWTLMTWLAARTERIAIAPNVLNLPLRQPAVVARSAASLDILSGGRFELGLGAGGFWDAIAAVGGERLTPGQAVDALSQGIDVIRGIWDVDDRHPLRAGGEYHHVDGAKRGPRAPHDIGIWVGALKPRMLRLVGEKADGWLPSLGYLQPGETRTSNLRIDDAATDAGRDPREIRRLLNVGGRFQSSSAGAFQGPPSDWVEQLLPLVLENGFSTFILAGDDPDAMSQFMAEVAPELRERVAAERDSTGTATGGRIRSASALAKRTTAIDYDALPASLAAEAVEPGDSAYGRVRHTYSYAGAPGLVLRPGNADEVADALAFARSQPVPLAIRSGGHGISGRATNDGGIVIDLRRMNRVSVLDADSGLVRIEAGARWSEVAAVLQADGLAISSGDTGSVGVGGLATTGGIGFLGRQFGLTIDHVVAAELVLADGTAVRVDAQHDPELFWAVRGAGANMGVVTALDLEASRVGNVVKAQLVYDATDAPALLESWARLVEQSPRELTSFLTFFPRQAGQPQLALAMTVIANDDVPTAERLLTPFLELAPLLQQEASVTTYSAVMAAAEGVHEGMGMSDSRSGLIDHVTPELAASIGALMTSGDAQWLQLRAVGGAVNDVPADATAYAHRHQNFSVIAGALGGSVAALDDRWALIEPSLDGMYLSFETRRTEHVLEQAFPPETLARLRRVKARVDPAGVFDQNFDLAPRPASAPASPGTAER